MNMRSVFVAVCPCCGFDVARAVPVPGGWRVMCSPEHNGCGAESAMGDTETEAYTLWNVGLGTFRQYCYDCGRRDGLHWIGCPSDYPTGAGVAA